MLIYINGMTVWTGIIASEISGPNVLGQEVKVNISSAVVHVVPARIDEACAALLAMPGVEIHARTPEGKVVVTLEDDDVEAAANRYVALHGVPGVAAVAMVYQYSDDELDTEEVEA